jgi:hypothetical protein
MKKNINQNYMNPLKNYLIEYNKTPKSNERVKKWVQGSLFTSETIKQWQESVNMIILDEE